jgi:hypothetical protein
MVCLLSGVCSMNQNLINRILAKQEIGTNSSEMFQFFFNEIWFIEREEGGMRIGIKLIKNKTLNS